jgi:hypothetical protein
MVLEQSDRVQAVVNEATSALLDWLAQGWILSDMPWNVDRARVQVHRDWYGPYWLVTFAVDDAPWFGDVITVEVEDQGRGDFRADVDGLAFVREHIECLHATGHVPKGHWRLRRQIAGNADGQAHHGDVAAASRL